MIYVCSLAAMPDHVRDLRPSHLVTLLGPMDQPATPPEVPAERHHRVEVHDITEPLDGCILPESHHVAGLIDFLGGWGSATPLLVHCFAGVSRSTAAALIALSLRAEGREAEAARHLRQHAPHAHPNRRIVALADRLLDRDGRLVAAADAMGPGDITGDFPLIRLAPLA
ncbi:MAG: protein tyrosine phosphatase [Alphaproteobacteria bacterium]